MKSRPFLLLAALVLSLPAVAHDISGVYSGTYVFQWDQNASGLCHPLTMESAISFELQHEGLTISGVVIMTEFALPYDDQFGNCTPQIQTMYVPVEGTVD